MLHFYDALRLEVYYQLSTYSGFGACDSGMRRCFLFGLRDLLSYAPQDLI
jgi:hypothetical protein